MKETQSKILDFYFDMSITIDIVLVILFCIFNKYLAFIPFILSDKANQLNIISNLIGTCVSLAGFILAALTIIVAFKSNLNAKKIEESENAMEMILSSVHYHSIVSVFKKSIIEFVICAIILYSVWASADNLTVNSLNTTVCSSIFIITMTIMRSLLVLFKILGMEKKQQ